MTDARFPALPLANRRVLVAPELFQYLVAVVVVTGVEQRDPLDESRRGWRGAAGQAFPTGAG